MTAPDYTWHEHFDYGLLREGPQLYFEQWFPKAQVWRPCQFNPFTASMSPITQVSALDRYPGVDLFAPSVESAAA